MTIFKFSNLMIAAPLLSVFMFSCGKSEIVSKADYRDQKNGRINAEQSLKESKSNEERYKSMLNSIQETENYTWVYSLAGELDYKGAEELCKNIGYTLPTEKMLLEAEKNQQLKTRMYLRDGSRTVFVQDKTEFNVELIVFCARTRATSSN